MFYYNDYDGVFMHFDFLKELFSEYDVDIYVKEDVETICIGNNLFSFQIMVDYYPDDYCKYLLRFATQHIDTSSKDDLINYIFSYANAEKAAIEFYKDGQACFGGEIETYILSDLTYDSLRLRFFHSNLKDYTFSVRAWDKRFCFDAYFEKDASGNMSIIKEIVS